MQLSRRGGDEPDGGYFEHKEKSLRQLCTKLSKADMLSC